MPASIRSLFVFPWLVLVLALASCADDKGKVGSSASGGAAESGGGSKPKTKKAAPETSAEATEYGFTQDGESISYGVVIENPSSDAEALDISVSVNALDNNGDVLGTDDKLVSVVPPGDNFNIGGDLSVGRSKVKDLEISVLTGDSGPPKHPLPEVTNVRMERDDFGSLTIRAQVTNTLDSPLSSITDVFTVVRDSNEEVIGGTFTFPTNDIPPGGRRGVELMFLTGLKGAASADVSVDNEIAP